MHAGRASPPETALFPLAKPMCLVADIQTHLPRDGVLYI